MDKDFELDSNRDEAFYSNNGNSELYRYKNEINDISKHSPD
jgi:hypothetical protein